MTLLCSKLVEKESRKRSKRRKRIKRKKRFKKKESRKKERKQEKRMFGGWWRRAKGKGRTVEKNKKRKT